MPQIGTEPQPRAIWKCRRCGHEWSLGPKNRPPKQCYICHCHWP